MIMTPLKPDQKDALAKAFKGFLDEVTGETEMEEETEDMGSEDSMSEDMPMKKKKGMAKYMEEM